MMLKLSNERRQRHSGGKFATRNGKPGQQCTGELKTTRSAPAMRAGRKAHQSTNGGRDVRNLMA